MHCVVGWANSHQTRRSSMVKFQFCRGFFSALTLGILLSAASAGPIADFDGVFRLAHADAPPPPPQFAEDAKWRESLDAITAILVRAKAEVAKGALAAGHTSLEAVRE